MKRFYLTKEEYSLRAFREWCRSYKFLLKPKYISLTDLSECFEEDEEIKMLNHKMREEFLKRSEKYLIKEIPHEHWYGHSYEKANVYVFCYNEKIFKVIENYTPYLLLSETDGSSCLSFPQDINIFRENGNLLLGTVSHEGIADLFIEENEAESIDVPGEFCEGSYIWKITKLPNLE